MAYKKAIELKADYGDAYNGLANIYNAKRSSTSLRAASTKASELAGSAPGALVGGRVAMLMRRSLRAVILWNAGKDRRRQEAVRECVARTRTMPRRTTARYGARERKATSRAPRPSRDVLEAGADRSHSRNGQRDSRNHQEIACRAEARRLRERRLVIDTLPNRLADVRERIARAPAGRARPRIHPSRRDLQDVFSDDVRASRRRGSGGFRRNKVRKPSENGPDGGPRDQLALVGHLQSNKARKVGMRFDVVQSLDQRGARIEAGRAAMAAGRKLDMLVQVDLAGEATKFGVREEDLTAICEAASECRAPESWA